MRGAHTRTHRHTLKLQVTAEMSVFCHVDAGVSVRFSSVAGTRVRLGDARQALRRLAYLLQVT